jgi:hypothetical protein
MTRRIVAITGMMMARKTVKFVEELSDIKD